MVIDFCRDWLFSKENCKARTVNLPHDAMLEEKRTAMCHNGERTGYFPGGKYEYSKILTLEENEAAGYVALHFGGVYRHAAVYLNGEEIIRHKYGYTSFTANLTGLAKPGDNLITVTVDNSLEPNSRWYTGSGIYRPVKLILSALERIEDVYIRTKSIKPAVIEISANVKDATTEIYDGDRMVASGKLGEVEVPNAKLWSAKSPSLYTCVIKTAKDEARMTFGIRTAEFSASKGFRINGEEDKLRGGCVHHDNGVLGACSFKDAEMRRVRILKKCGFNAIRCAHNPCSEELLEACDELGMYVMDEAYDGWYTPKNHHDSSRDFEEEYEAVLTAMALRDRNHPSVILYSIGNEVTEVGEARGVELAAKMQALIRRTDPTRLVTCGVNAMLTVWGRMGLAVYKDRKPYEAVPLPKETIKIPKSGSSLFNALAAKLGKVMDFQTAGKQADSALAGIAGKLDILGLNYGWRRYDKELSGNDGRLLLGAENRIDSLPEIWKKVSMNKAICGDFCWSAIDYIGEAGIGYWSYPSDKGLPLLAGCGAIDLIGAPDAMNGFQRIIWGLESKPYISVRPLNLAKERPIKKAWRFTNGISSWTWRGFEGVSTITEVFSAAHTVELRLNGRSLGKKRVRNYIAEFKVVYENGILEAIAYNKSGARVSHSALKTGGKPEIRVSQDRDVLAANGQDLLHVSIELLDDQSILSPLDGVEVSVQVAGKATLQGFGSAACVTDEIFIDNIHKTYRGRLLAVVRAGYEPGEAVVSVTTKKYGSKTITINVQGGGAHEGKGSVVKAHN